MSDKKNLKHPSYQIPLSVASSIQLYTVQLVSFDFIFIDQFNAETMKSTQQDERSVEHYCVAYYFQAYIYGLTLKHENIASII